MTYFDTDVVIHSIIVQDQLKHNQAIDLIRQAIENETFFISFLVLHETAFVLSKLRFSSEFISENINLGTYQALSTIAGSEVVGEF